MSVQIKASQWNAGALTDQTTVWVTKSDLAKNCEPGSAEPLELGLKTLEADHIKVLEYRKGQEEGVVHAQMCGIPKGTQNAYRIYNKDLQKALKLGFHSSRNE